MSERRSGDVDGAKRPGRRANTDWSKAHSGDTPGRTAGTDAPALQLKAAPAGPAETASPDEAHARAREGVAGGGSPFPFLDQIQRAFGAHDISRVMAHVGPEAAAASEAIGAEAYAYGDHVAFARVPDLHTAAHEAAHVVQQRAGVSLSGGIGQKGDRYEAEADAVADAVVAGRSAEQLLDRMTGGRKPAGGGSGGAAIQRKDGEQKDRTLPDGVNMQILTNGNVVVRVSWIYSDPAVKDTADGLSAPTRMVEILRSLKASNVLGWMDDAKIPSLANKIVISPKLAKTEKFREIALTTDIFIMIGPPPGVDVLVFTEGKGLLCVLRMSTLVPGGIKKAGEVEFNEVSKKAVVDAVEAYTGMPIEPDVKKDLIDNQKYKPWADPENQGVRIPFPESTLEWMYGKKEWAEHLKHPKKKAEDAGAAGVSTTGGVQFSTDVSEEDRKYYLDWMKLASSGAGSPSASEAAVTPLLIAKLKELDKDPVFKAKVVAQLKGGGGKSDGKPFDLFKLENAIAAAKADQAYGELGMKPPSDGETYKPLYDTPVLGTIVNRGALNYVGQSTQFYFEVQNAEDPFAVPNLQVQWILTKKSDPKTHLKEKIVHYVDVRSKEREYFEYAWKDTGIHTIHAFVTHSFYRPAHFQIDVEVKTEAQRTKEINDPAFKGLQGGTDFTMEDWPFDVSWFNTMFGGHKQEYGKLISGTTPADFKRKTYEERVDFLAKDKEQLEAMIKAHTKDGTLKGEAADSRWKDMVEYAKDRLDSIDKTNKTLEKERDDKNTFFEARGTFLSRKNGVPDKALKLVASAKKDSSGIKTIVHDFTQLYEPMDYTFSATGKTFEAALQSTFVDLCKSYPPGKVSALFEALNDNVEPLKKTIGWEFDTGTAWKDVKAIVYNPTVMMVVNIAAAATMVFLPVTAPVLFPMLATYNSIETIDNMAQLQAKGNLTWGNIAKGVAQIGLNFLPYVGELKVVAQFGKAAMYTLEGITIAGMGVLMTIDGVEQIRALRDKDISAIAKLDGEIRELERTNPSDPELAGKKAQLETMIKAAQNRATEVIQEMAKSGAVMLMQMGALKGLQAHMNATSIAGLKKEGIFTHVEGVEPHYDPKTGTIKGDEGKLDHAKVQKLKDAYALDMAAKQTELANVLGTDKITVTRGGTEVKVTKEGDGYKVEIPSDKTFADAVDEAWKVRKAVDPTAPAEKPAPIVAEIRPTLDPHALVKTQNVAVGTPLATEAEGQGVLRRLAAGDRGAFKQLGMEAPPREFDLRSVEWGLGQTTDGSFIIIRGEPNAVNWSGFGGVKPVAHSHPLTPKKMIPGGQVTFGELVKGGGKNDLTKVNVFPSAADVEFTARHGLNEHTVQTPYASKGGGKIGNPAGDAHEQLVSIKIIQPEHYGIWAGNPEIGVYKSKMVAVDGTGKVLWEGEVFSVDHPGVGSLIMFDEPPGSLVTKRVAGEALPAPAPKPTNTPASKPLPEIPPEDHVRVHDAADKHVDRDAQPWDLPPEAKERAKAAARTAAEIAYREKARDGAKPKTSREAANDAGKNAGKLQLQIEAKKATEAKVEETISDGSVFDQSKLPRDAKAALAEYETGTRGAAAKRLTGLLEGKTWDEMSAIMKAEEAAGNCKYAQEDLTDYSGTTGATQKQDVYAFGDGTVVRMKPKGDKHEAGKPMFSVEVKQVPPGDAGPKLAGIAFKVDAKGRPVPKWPKDLKNPYNPSRYADQYDMYEKAVMRAGHREVTP